MPSVHAGLSGSLTLAEVLFGNLAVPASYFMLTFTVPAEFRELAWYHQRWFYAKLFDCAWDTVNTFSHNDRKLQGQPGAVAVLHTHSRRLDYHPHVHLVRARSA